MAESRGDELLLRGIRRGLTAASVLVVIAVAVAGCAGKAVRDGASAPASGGAGSAGAVAALTAGQGGVDGPGVGGSNASGAAPAGGASMSITAGTDAGLISGAGAGGSVGDSSAAGQPNPGDAGGDAGHREADGIDCYGGGGQCAPGEQCVTCDASWLCVPDPARDPNGYATATADCTSTDLVAECDGPEDCAKGEYCVSGPSGKALRCSPAEPGMTPLDCCLPCFEAGTSCTLCWTDADCPAGESCTAKQVWTNDVGGCLPGP